MAVSVEYNRIVREAIESTLDIMGYSGRDAILYDLEQQGAYSRENDKYISLWDVGDGLRNLFGQEASEMIMERIILRMDKLSSIQCVQSHTSAPE
jgi:hypothetical protein